MSMAIWRESIEEKYTAEVGSVTVWIGAG